MRKNKILIISGLIMIVLGIAFNVLMFISSAWPTYLYFILMGIGIVMVFIGLVSRQIRPLWQSVIVASPFICLYISYRINSPSEDTFLIPQAFRGTVYLYYDQVKGVPQEYEHGRRLYRIPPDGILLSQSPLKGDVIDLSGTEYYLEDSLTHGRTRLRACGVHEVTDTSTLQVIYGVCGSSSLYGTYQTIYVGVPTRSFLDRDPSPDRVHDSIMLLKTSKR